MLDIDDLKIHMSKKIRMAYDEQELYILLNDYSDLILKLIKKEESNK